MKLNEIELKIYTHELNALQVFTQMMQHIKSDKDIEDIKNNAIAETLYDVETHLRYEYDGPYDLSSISEFFNEKADELIK